MTQWYVHPVGNFWLVTGIALALFVALWRIGLPRGRVSRGRRLVLSALRSIVLLLLLFAMLRPTLLHTTTKKQAATLVMVMDATRSMTVADAFGGKTRWDALRAVVKEAQPGLNSLGENVEVKLYTFDADLHETERRGGTVDLPKEPLGRQTAMGSILEDVLKRQAGKRLAGVILLSDGAQRAFAPRDVPPQIPARRLADLGFPLYVLSFGQGTGARQARDVALRDLNVNQSVFVKNQLSVVGSARIEGYAGQKIPVELRFESPAGKMELVASDFLTARADGTPVPIRLSHIPQVAGEYKVTARLAEQPGELLTTNNELSTFVTVLGGGINVLYLESALRVEQKFIRRALNQSPDIKVDYVRLVPGESAARPNLAELLVPGKYDVFIVGDVDSSLFTEDELRAMTTAVQHGAGLVMLGGFHSFGPGGFGSTALADVLPVEMERLERQGQNEPIRTDLHVPGPIRMRPAPPLGTNHYLMSFAARAGETDLWNKLPALEGANRFPGAKPSAQILAETEDGAPLLLAQEAGGRVLALAVDSTWRWVLQGYEDAHRRFWRQIVLWLARKDQIEQGDVWIKIAERRFAPGAHVDFTTAVRSAEGQDVSDASFKAELRLPSGTTTPVTLSREGSQMRGIIDRTQDAGDYTLSISATAGGKSLGSAKVRFLVYEQDLELDNPAADPTLLASLAKITEQAGGQSLAPEELPDLLARIKRQPQELEVQTQIKQTPWDTWPFMLLFMSIICIEWFLRKRWGLV